MRNFHYQYQLITKSQKNKKKIKWYDQHHLIFYKPIIQSISQLEHIQKVCLSCLETNNQNKQKNNQLIKIYIIFITKPIRENHSSKQKFHLHSYKTITPYHVKKS